MSPNAPNKNSSDFLSDYDFNTKSPVAFTSPLALYQDRQEERSFLGEKSNHMLIVISFNDNLKVHIRQFYVKQMKTGRIGITLSVQEFNETKVV